MEFSLDGDGIYEAITGSLSWWTWEFELTKKCDLSVNRGAARLQGRGTHLSTTKLESWETPQVLVRSGRIYSNGWDWCPNGNHISQLKRGWISNRFMAVKWWGDVKQIPKSYGTSIPTPDILRGEFHWALEKRTCASPGHWMFCHVCRLKHSTSIWVATCATIQRKGLGWN